ncbi:MAG: DNA-formamidopyrimidine glycosylase [Candidatus Omnitrophica bacterium]|nr:DNA-formamidopyrimidine glycosylase [Candidatus Omnitrophota bacterium]MCF7876878.1 DNA-formamidopyrimidine glycosylase [Candidatus Omnitrophota bacterium]MCF7877945.1 DNA-formamidopyrimidine glycosylase [Candidatus Omnitrophota bacterium]MCF7892692.1 DNA-formamidopyrimidine glycosylase [Candidatus Omnitrophota bacterium]
MPELPEVATIQKDLEKKVAGKKIVGLKIKKSRVIKEPSVAKFKKEIIGKKIEKIIRKGKLLIFKLQPGCFLIIHLRITGWLRYGKEEPKARVLFKISDGNFLNYMDSRLLGHLRLRKEYKDLNFLQRLGPEIFQLTSNQFKQMLKRRKANVKSLIMNQNFIAGVGNIYAQEALFLAKIDPRRSATSLTVKEKDKLYEKLKAVLAEAIKYRGSSVDSYRNLEGQAGGMEKRLKVYGKKNQPCPICKKPLKKTTIAGRGTCFCPNCQK